MQKSLYHREEENNIHSLYTIQMNGETLRPLKSPGVLTLIWFTSIAVKLLLAGPPAHAATLMNNKIVIVCFSLSHFKIN